MGMKKAQVSIELLVTIGVVLAFTIPIIFLLFSLSQFGLENAAVAQAEGASKKISDNLNEVFSQGPQSKRSILVNLPSSTQSVNVSGRQVVVTIKTSSGIYDAASPIFAKVSNTEIRGRTGPITLQLIVNPVTKEVDVFAPK
jgi:uncharacterized protein (UPF0333 family)